QTQHEQGTGNVDGNAAHGPQITLLHHQGHDLGGKGGKSSQATQKARHDEHAPAFVTQAQAAEIGHCDTHQIAANQVSQQSTGGQGGEQGIQSLTQKPTRQCAQGTTGGNIQHGYGHEGPSGRGQTVSEQSAGRDIYLG